MRVVSNTLSDGIGRSALGTAQYIGEVKVQAALAKAEAMDSLSAAKAEAVDSLSAVKAEAVDSLSAVATGAVDSLSAVKAGAVDGLSAVKEGAVDSLSAVKNGAVDGLSAVKEGAVDSLSAVKNGALDGISAVQSSGEKRLESLKKQYSRKTAALSRMVRGTRYFGAGRLLRAFPQMRHRKYRELLDKLKKDAPGFGSAHFCSQSLLPRRRSGRFGRQRAVTLCSRPRRRRRLRQRSNPQSRTLLYPSRSLPSTSAGKAGETAR